MSHRSWTCVGALCCAAVFSAAGCQKDQLDQTEAARASADSPPEASRPFVRQPSARRGRSLPLESWSPDAEALFGIDMGQFRDSPVGTLVDNWLRTVVSRPAGCGADIVEHVGQVLVVMNSVDEGKPLYVLGGVSRSQAKGCTSAPSAWLDDTTLVLAPDWQQAALDAEVAATNRRTNARVLEAVSNIDTSAALWVAAATARDKKDWADDFDELRGTLALDGGLRATFGVKYRNPDKAASAAESFESTIKNMPLFTEYFEVARAYADGPWLRTSVVMSSKQLEKFATEPMFSGLFPSPPDTDLAARD